MAASQLWQSALKVYFKKEVQAFETIRHGPYYWVAFTIVHRMNSQEVSYLEAVHPSTIEFKFSEDQNQPSMKVAGDSDGDYYGFRPAESIDNVQFRPVFQVSKSEAGLKSGKRKAKKIGTLSSESSRSFPEVDNSEFMGWKIPLNFLKFRRIINKKEHIKQCLDKGHLIRIIKKMKRLTIPPRRSRRSSIQSRKTLKERAMSNDIISFEVEKLFFGMKTPSFLLEEIMRSVLLPSMIDFVPKTVIKSIDHLALGCSLAFSVEQRCIKQGSWAIYPLWEDKSAWVIESESLKTKNIAHTIYLSAFSWMTDNARKTLNPLGIQIHKINNISESELVNKRIKSVYIECELEPIIPKTRSPLIEINEHFNKASLKWVKTFLTKKFSPVEFISQLQSKKLSIVLLGKSSEEENEEEGHIFGSQFEDYNISNFIKTKIPQVNSKQDGWFKDLVLLATAAIDLSPLVFGSSCVIELVPLTSKFIRPKVFECGNKFFEDFNAITIHSDRNLTYQGLLSDCSLVHASLKFSAKISFLLRICSLDLLETNSTYHRALAIIFDGRTAASVLNAIWEYNKQSLNFTEFNVPLIPFRGLKKVRSGSFSNSLCKYESKVAPISTSNGPPKLLNEEASSSEDTHNYLDSSKASTTQFPTEGLDKFVTGFFIDCIEYTIIMVEGLAAQTFPNVHEQLMKISVDKGRVMYSSELIYKERLYKVFKHFGGLYCIAMRKSPKDLLSKKATYLEGSIPVPAKELLNSIPKLKRSKCLLSVVQDNLLPTPIELMSFDIEFGLPLCVNFEQ